MNATEISRYIAEMFENVDVVEASGDSFFFYNPPELPVDHMFPFTTLVTSNINDQFSNLDRPSVFRLNIGVSKETFRSLFNLPPGKDKEAESDEYFGKYDFAALDQLMPHPVYGRMYWVCILNPDNASFETKVRPLLTEAYERAVSKRK